MNDCKIPVNETPEKIDDQHTCMANSPENTTNELIDELSAQDTVSDSKPPVESSGNSSVSALKEKMLGLISGVIARQIIQKVITLVFALVVFSFAYMQMASHRNILTYMGVMLLMVLVYAEILVIRDHLWVIEGSMRESRRWRDVFFNQTAMRRQRLRKFFILIFSMAIFSFLIVKSAGKLDPVLTFMGLILMITVLYYEVLNIRDEVWLMMQSISANQSSAGEDRKEVYDKFLAETAAANAAKHPETSHADNSSELNEKENKDI